MFTIIQQRLLKRIHQNQEAHAVKLDQYYFGYGANSNPKVFATRLKNVKLVGPATLQDSRLVFNMPCEFKNKGFAGVVPSLGSRVHGTLYKVSWEGLALMDILEWVPFHFYSRQPMTVKLNDGSQVRAFVYVTKHPRTGLKPSQGYLDYILNAAKDLGFPPDYMDYLKSHPTQEKFELDHSFNLADPSKPRFFPAVAYVWHDRLREKLCSLI